MITLTAAAHCQHCDWTSHGEWGPVDKAAEAHARTGHAVGTMASVAQSDAARQAEREQQQRADAMRASTSLVSWSERFGARVDHDLTAAVLGIAAELHQRSRRTEGEHGG